MLSPTDGKSAPTIRITAAMPTAARHRAGARQAQRHRESRRGSRRGLVAVEAQEDLLEVRLAAADRLHVGGGNRLDDRVGRAFERHEEALTVGLHLVDAGKMAERVGWSAASRRTRSRAAGRRRSGGSRACRPPRAGLGAGSRRGGRRVRPPTTCATRGRPYGPAPQPRATDRGSSAARGDRAPRSARRGSGARARA